ncbi:hypothetical protein PM082_024866 [Marasmius tenuissimus]|nr:hypothetical protein PM082_024866 [Marasmius tenuissimus]
MPKYVPFSSLLSLENIVIYPITTLLSVIFFNAIKTNDDSELIEYVTDDPLRSADDAIWSIVAILANSLADMTLIHRCYVIWDRRKRVGIPLLVLASATNLFGLIAASVEIVGARSDFRIYTLGSDMRLGYTGAYTAVNILITLMTG